MAFQSAGDFLFLAAKKYKLDKQALAGMLCARVRKFFAQEYSEFAEAWEPVKFQHGKLSIKVTDAAASSALFMRTFELVEQFQDLELPAQVNEILIVRNS